MGRATGLHYPHVHLPSTSFPIPLVIFQCPQAERSSPACQLRATLSSEPDSQHSCADPTALTLFQIYTRNLALVFTKCIKQKKNKNILASFAPVTIGDNTRLSRSYSGAPIAENLPPAAGRPSRDITRGNRALPRAPALRSKITALPQPSQTRDKNDFPIGFYPASFTFPRSSFTPEEPS